MSHRSVEYMIVAFPGNQFKGEIVPALEGAGRRRHDPDHRSRVRHEGRRRRRRTAELADLDSDVFKAFDALSPETMGLLNQDDLAAAGEELDPNSSAALLVWEDVWATKLRDAIVNAKASSSIWSGCRTRSFRRRSIIRRARTRGPKKGESS